MKKDIIRVFGTNLIKMAVTFLTAFIVPMILTVEDYGYLKTYTFYASYIGITHLGFCDGIYLYYGGKNENEIDRETISKQGGTIFFYELAVALCLIVISAIRANYILICVGISIVPHILYTFYSYVYQAIGDFKKYTLIMNVYSIVNLAVNSILVLTKNTDYRIYVGMYVAVEFAPFLVGLFLFKRSKWIAEITFDLNIFTKYVKMGILLMIGNFAYSLFIGIDKWFIKFTMTIKYFSLYSFGTQMLTVVNMFITPIAMTLYSNLSRKKDHNFEIRIKKLIICLLMLIPIAIYILEYVITKFMKQYEQAITVTSLLLISQIFLCLNSAIYVNLYKTYKKQRDYFIRLCIALALAFVLDAIIAAIRPNMILFATSTLISCITWMFLNVSYFKYMRPNKLEIVYVLTLFAVYGALQPLGNHLIKAVIYLFAYAAATRICMKNEWEYYMDQMLRFKQKITSPRR